MVLIDRLHLAASIFHYGTYTVGEIKDYLMDKGLIL
jgi:imidazole glycerol phosphate synthase subunit HisF